jgi:hypothetical protein
MTVTISTLSVTVGAVFGGFFWQLGKSLFLIVMGSSRKGRDSTDPEKGRSGLKPLRDEATGVEYLMSPTGHLTPRLNLDGKPAIMPKDPEPQVYPGS